MAAGQVIDLNEFGNFLRQIVNDIGGGNQEQFFEGLYPKASMVLVSQTKMAFHNGTSPSGIPWKGLEHQRVRGSGSPAPLRDTGELMASVTANGPGHIERRENFWLVFGSAHVKAWHNNGGTITAVRAKFLCIPATKEALYAGSPRNFPGKLFFLWNEQTGKGVAIGVARDYRLQERQAEIYEYRREQIKLLMQKPARLGGVKRTRRARFRLLSLKSWYGLAKRIGRGAKKSKFWKRISKLIGFSKKRQRTKIKKPKAKTFKKKKPPQPGTRQVHYYLRKSVVVPARPFLEITVQTEEKLSRIAYDHGAEYIQKKITGD